MKNNQKASFFVGTVLFLTAALFSISLLLVLFDFETNHFIHENFLYKAGKMFTGVYGICSALIPVFLLIAAIQCFMSKWRARNGVMLLGSVIPFFTLDAIEHLCRMSLENFAGDVLTMRLVTILITGAIIVVAEYLVLSVIGDFVERLANRDGEEKKEFNESDENENSDEDIVGTDSDLFNEENEGEISEHEKDSENAEDDFAPKIPLNLDDENTEDEFLDNEDKNENEENDKIDEIDKIEETEATGKIVFDEDNPFTHIFDYQNESPAGENPGDDEISHNEEPAEDSEISEDTESAYDDTEIAGSDTEFGEISAEFEDDEEPADDAEIFDGTEPADDAENSEGTEFYDSSETENVTEEIYGTPENPEEETLTEDLSWLDEPAIENINPEGSSKVEFLETVEDEHEPEFKNHAEMSEEALEFRDDAYVVERTSNIREVVASAEDSPFDNYDYENLEIENSAVERDVNYIAENSTGLEIDEIRAFFDEFGDEEENETVPVLEKSTENLEGFTEITEISEIEEPSDDEDVPDVELLAQHEEEKKQSEEKDLRDVMEFEEERKNRFASIFSQMDEDAANSPNFGDENKSGFDDYEFDPTARPIVDANGLPYETSVPVDVEHLKISRILTENDENQTEFDSFNSDDVFKDEFTDENSSLGDIEFENEEENDELLDDDEDFIDEENDDEDDEENEENEEKEENEIGNIGIEEETVVEEKKEEQRKPKLSLRNYKIPTEGILTTYPNGEYWVIDDETRNAAEDLKATLNEFKIEADIKGIRKGPVVTMFEILPAPGVKLNKIVSLQDNIALRLAASSVRIVAPIPGKHAVGIEVPNRERAVVSFKEIVDAKLPEFDKMAIPVILGKDISGEPQIIDLAKTPHLLIAGSTGSGKSVCVNSMLLSILFKRSPNQVKLVLIDPKIVELKLYNDIPHLLTPVITEPKKALQSLQYCLCEMERRYALLDAMGVRDISSYNRRIMERKLMQEKIPYIVVIIDEFADLMATTGKELESTIARLAAMSRAVGIHLVLATQRPSIDVITGLIKANIPSRIAFMVASKMDSRIIIDQVGAEKLLGKGDMLYASATDPAPVRIQGTLVSDDEVERVVEYVKQYGEPEYIDDEIFIEDDDEIEEPGLFSDGEDPLYDQALQIVVQAGKASASYIQRRLKIGYNRAARLVEEMEERGIVGPQNGSKPREIIHLP